MGFIIFVVLLFGAYILWVSMKEEEERKEKKKKELINSPENNDIKNAIRKKRFNFDLDLNKRYWAPYENCISYWDLNESKKFINLVFTGSDEFKWDNLLKGLDEEILLIDDNSYTERLFLEKARDSFSNQYQLKGYLNDPLNYAINSKDIDLIIKTALLSFAALDLKASLVNMSKEAIRQLKEDEADPEKVKQNHLQFSIILYTAANLLLELITSGLEISNLIYDRKIDPQYLLIKQYIKPPEAFRELVESSLNDDISSRYKETMKPTIEFLIHAHLAANKEPNAEFIYTFYANYLHQITLEISIGNMEEAEKQYKSAGLDALETKVDFETMKLLHKQRKESSFEQIFKLVK